MRYAASVRVCQKPAAPVIRAKGLGVPAGPDFHATIAHHLEFRAVAVKLAERLAQIVSRALRPIEENVDAHQILLRPRLLLSRLRCSLRFCGKVFRGLQSLRRLAD